MMMGCYCESKWGNPRRYKNKNKFIHNESEMKDIDAT